VVKTGSLDLSIEDTVCLRCIADLRAVSRSRPLWVELGQMWNFLHHVRFAIRNRHGCHCLVPCRYRVTVFPVTFPVPQVDLGKFGIVPVHQKIFPVTLLSCFRVVEAPLLHGMAIHDDDLVVGNCVFGVNPNGDASVRSRGR
jgi:hypothetical protein